jgi:hypothetical protein
MDSHKGDHVYQKGIDAFNTGHFYEAHEHWEEVWLETPNPDKMFLQGLIQVAAAFHHHSRANRLGTRNLLQAGLQKLDCFPGIHGGLEIEELRQAVRGWLAAIAAGESVENSTTPPLRPSNGRRPSI